ncbi:glycosyltransferase [Marinomonas primoryensis]|uniref:Glycosyl transferase family 1 domain-containing protein n=1 Tax=Marinomonas primoryensis TaxID=178399 RepID=A0A859CZ63_9GAMM|nr:glycosyltransferase [Marinomonas primoryensis]QKK81963.1 uncharacterized protein MP3633_3236 [Marinomonas primoryensis]
MENKKRSIIYHYSLPFNFDSPSGSGIRPVAMYNTFINLGYDVELVSGYTHEREKKIKKIKSDIKKGKKFEFCYSESTTMPLALTDLDHLPRRPLMDFRFFYFLKKNGVSTGVFYRDIYWRFDNTSKRSLLHFFKKKAAKFFYLVELLCYRLSVKVIFLPSLKMSKYVPFIPEVMIHELNPGTTAIKTKVKKLDSKIEFLYVGGTTDFYNIDLLIEVVGKYFVNSINLTICTRPSDAIYLANRYNEFNTNLTIVSKKGEQLKSLYEASDCACLYMLPTEYRNFSVPIKLFEYMSYGKPIIASSNTWVGDFVQNNKLGWTVNYSESELIKIIKKIVLNKEIIKNLSISILDIAKEHTWEKRCKQVSIILSDM